jgi:hypothetical protein
MLLLYEPAEGRFSGPGLATDLGGGEVFTFGVYLGKRDLGGGLPTG